MAQYTIREISEMFQLPTSTLRYYEDMEILTNIKRNNSGQRIYEDCHVNRLRTICCFKNAGMSISQLKEFFSYESEEATHIDDILLLLNDHKSSINEQIKNDYSYLEKVISATLKHEKVENAIFSIIFVDNDEIKKINKEREERHQAKINKLIEKKRDRCFEIKNTYAFSSFIIKDN